VKLERAIPPAIVLCFFASGAAGLVYQVLWTRQLSLIFGVTTYAVATVLATFSGGGGEPGKRRSEPLEAPLELPIRHHAILRLELLPGRVQVVLEHGLAEELAREAAAF